MSNFWWFLAGALSTLFVFVIWASLVMAARCDAEAEAMEDLMASNDKGNYPREEETD